MVCVLISEGLKRGFFERRGHEGFAEGAKKIPTVFGVVTFARLGVYRPLYRPKRNQHCNRPHANLPTVKT
jgi:hypothetical protein